MHASKEACQTSTIVRPGSDQSALNSMYNSKIHNLISKLRHLAHRVRFKEVGTSKVKLKITLCLPCLAGRRGRRKSRRGAVGASLACIYCLDLTVFKPVLLFM